MKAKADWVFENTRRKVKSINTYRHSSVPDLCSQVREVVVIASSSRGGSSIFTEILRHSPKLLHFKGEINPFLVLAGLSYPNNGRSGDILVEDDAGPQNSAKLTYFEQEMALDVGINEPVDLNEIEMYNRFKNDLHWRLCVQWPEIEIERDFLFSQIEATFDELKASYGWEEGDFNDPQLFHILLLRNLRKKYPGINPYYYDLRPDIIKEYCPDVSENFDSPSCCIIEEPPFVLISPRKYISPALARSKPLVLKTPSNVYRLPFLKKIFHNARFKILHLVRNPADSINGLFDGWQYNGFFSHNMYQKLNIRGYSDVSPSWGKDWWKYDLPPGWEELINWPLEYVCGYQWRSAHREILKYKEQNNPDYLRIKFEEVIGPLATRQEKFTELSDWLGVDGKEIINAALTEDLPPVMVTTKMSPRKRRWFKKVALIRPVLVDPEMQVVNTAERLGYSLNEEIGR